MPTPEDRRALEFLQALDKLKENSFFRELRDASGDISFGIQKSPKKDKFGTQPDVNVELDKGLVNDSIMAQLLPQLVSNYINANSKTIDWGLPRAISEAPLDQIEKALVQSGLTPAQLLAQMLPSAHGPNGQANYFLQNFPRFATGLFEATMPSGTPNVHMPKKEEPKKRKQPMT